MDTESTAQNIQSNKMVENKGTVPAIIFTSKITKVIFIVGVILMFFSYVFITTRAMINMGQVGAGDEIFYGLFFLFIWLIFPIFIINLVLGIINIFLKKSGGSIKDSFVLLLTLTGVGWFLFFVSIGTFRIIYLHSPYILAICALILVIFFKIFRDGSIVLSE